MLAVLLGAQAPPSPSPLPSPVAADGVDVVELADADGVPGLRATFVVDAPADVVLDLLWAGARFRSIFPDIKALDVVARPDDRTVDVRFFVDAVVATPTYTLRRSLDRGRRRVAWVSVGGDLKKIVGAWTVAPLSAGRSRVIYESYVDVGVVGVSSVYRSLVVGRVEQMAARVQRAAQSALAAQAALAAPAARAPGAP